MSGKKTAGLIAGTILSLTNPQSSLAENQKQSPILLAQNEVKSEVATKLATNRAKQELESLGVVLGPKKQNALGIDEKVLKELGIEMSQEDIDKYNELYVQFKDRMGDSIKGIKSKLKLKRRKKNLEKYLVMLDGFSVSSKIDLLKRYQKGSENAKFDKNNPEYELATRLVKLQAGIENYKNYLEGGELDKNLSLELELDAQGLNNSFPGTLTEEQLQVIVEVESYVTKKLKEELQSEKEELQSEKEELQKLKNLLAKFKILAG